MEVGRAIPIASFCVGVRVSSNVSGATPILSKGMGNLPRGSFISQDSVMSLKSVSRVFIEDALLQILTKRQCFHSEADFQFALAWQIHEMKPKAEIRLEMRYIGFDLGAGIGYLDILVTDAESRIGIELKYVNKDTEFEAKNGERYSLKVGTDDCDSYDCCKDIRRLEWLREHGHIDIGFGLVLSNNPAMWEKRGKRKRPSDPFHLFEGTTLSGTLAWAPLTKSAISRETPIKLRGSYPIAWRGVEKCVTPGFRYLLLRIN